MKKIDEYADKWNVSSKTMHHIIQCESNYNTNIQSGHVYPIDHPEWGVKAGERELSFGLVQIHLPAHKDITREQALDVDFSLNFLAQGLSEGKGSMWSCY